MSFSHPALWLLRNGRVIMRRKRRFFESLSLSFFTYFCPASMTRPWLWECVSGSEPSDDVSPVNDSFEPFRSEEVLSNEIDGVSKLSPVPDSREISSDSSMSSEFRVLLLPVRLSNIRFRQLLRALPMSIFSLSFCSEMVHFVRISSDKPDGFSFILLELEVQVDNDCESSDCERSLRPIRGFVSARTKSSNSGFHSSVIWGPGSSMWTSCKTKKNGELQCFDIFVPFLLKRNLLYDWAAWAPFAVWLGELNYHANLLCTFIQLPFWHLPC